ncbi:MAG: glycosyl hydrolase [Cyclobacteriaceae bacterium]|nr:glycosyl hydrolase [Cyclobacteriaceae bacterium]
MRVLITWLAFLMAAVPLFSQKKEVKPTIPAFDAGAYKGIKWRNIGPFRGGRANAITGIPGNDNVYFVGYTGGGIAKTEDAGITWKNISDGFFTVGTIGEIAVCEGDPNVIYVGSGEHAVRGVMTSYGDGVYKTTDGGKTWKNIGLEKTRHISDIAIDPKNPDIVLVGAQGAVHGPSADRGVFKSTDGGKTWRKTLFVDDNTGVSSLSMDGSNSRILYAATWQHRRYPWTVESGGPGCGIWKSNDQGETWTKINNGLPTPLGKIGVSVSKANPSRVYAIVESSYDKMGVYRSDDGGAQWHHMTNDNAIMTRPWYYNEIFPDPVNEDVVYVLNSPMMKSTDGGKTFSFIRVGHGDTHDLWINPKNTNNIALADDGGGEITFNGGKSWSPLDNQATAQFYRVNVDNRFPFWVYGGQQDNTSVMTKSRTNSFGITIKDWIVGPGCESAFIAFDDPNNPQNFYGGCYQGVIDVLNINTGEVKDIRVYPEDNLSREPRKMKYRFNWNAPFINSPHDPKIMYHAGNVLFRTMNGGLQWEVISPDLTRNDSTRQRKGGGPITNEGAGGENYNTIYYVVESAHERGVIYTGSDCGLVYLTRDNGKSWKDVTPKGLPESMIHSIEVSPHEKGTVYISASRYKFNDFSSMTYKSTDYGTTWTKLGAVDNDDFIKVIREDKKLKNLLYAGAERGFYVSYNGGTNWQRLQLNLPIVPVTDLIIKDNDLVAATAGRSFWILDDLGALQQSGGNLAAHDIRLFTPKPTYRLSSVKIPLYLGNIPGLGENPLDGVTLDYYFKEKPDTTTGAKLEILDASGKVIRHYSSKKNPSFKPSPGGPPAPELLPAEPGVNRFAWDFRTDLLEGSGAFIAGDYSGYRVAPGTYKARLTANGQTSETEFEIIPDPWVKSSSADWTAQQQLLQNLTDEFNEIQRTIRGIRKVKNQITQYNEQLGNDPQYKDLIDAGKQLLQKLEAWEADYVQLKAKKFQIVTDVPNKLLGDYLQLKSAADTHDPRLTQGVQERTKDLKLEWQKKKASYSILQQQDIERYNKLFREKGLPALISETKEPVNN